MGPEENGRIDMLYRLVEQMRKETNHRFDRLEARNAAFGPLLLLTPDIGVRSWSNTLHHSRR